MLDWVPGLIFFFFFFWEKSNETMGEIQWWNSIDYLIRWYRC